MQLQSNKSVLLNVCAAAGADIVVGVGGDLTIQGLETFKQPRILEISRVVARAETSQVVKVGGTAYVPVANTVYSVLIGDVNRRVNGQIESLKKYSYTTPAVITTLGATAALQSEAIHLGIIAKINAVSTNWVTAATLGTGTGFTITDRAGYFPVNKQGITNRLGASTVKTVVNPDGTGFAANNIALTTAAIYSSGIGALLASTAPFYDLVTGHLISGEIFAPKTVAGALAVAGQLYNLYSITFTVPVPIPTVGGQTRGFIVKTHNVWVDNGAGVVTTNATNHTAFAASLLTKANTAVVWAY